MSQTIRILLAEDHYLARMALRTILSSRPEMELLAEAESGDQAVELFRRHRPDVTIMDLRIPGLDGFEAIAAIRRESPEAGIVVLTNYDGSEDVYRALQLGARAYLNKDTSGEQLIEAILTVHRGGHYLPKPIGDRLAQRIPKNALTPREMDVLCFIARGCSNREIGRHLDIAEKTVRIHVSNVLDKLGVADRTQAAIAAIHRGIVHLDPPRPPD